MCIVLEYYGGNPINVSSTTPTIVSVKPEQMVTVHDLGGHVYHHPPFLISFEVGDLRSGGHFLLILLRTFGTLEADDAFPPNG